MRDAKFKIPDELSGNDFSLLKDNRLPECQIFEHRHWQGRSYRTNLNVPWVGNWWNDKISGIIIASGTWRFFEHIDYGGASWDLGIGYYEFISDHGIPNDVISSFKVISY